MKQIIALVIFVCASYGVQAQGQCVMPNEPAKKPATAASSNATKTGHVMDSKAKTGHVMDNQYKTVPLNLSPSQPAPAKQRNN